MLVVLLYLQSFLKLFSRDFRLSPPYHQTNISEIEYWTLRGTTTNLKSFIRLTSPVQNKVGSICHRLPFPHESWTAEVEISAHGGTSGHGIWFLYTVDVCPEVNDYFNGFTIWVNTTSADTLGNSDVYFLENDGNEINPHLIQKIGQINIRTSGKANKLMIKKSKNKVIISKSESYRQSKLSEQVLKNPILTGYFSVAAMTTQHTGNHDLHLFLVHTQSHEISDPKKTDYNTINRKIIENDVLSRREKKKERRSHLPLMQKYTSESNEHDHAIQGTRDSLSEAAQLIREILTRTDYMLTSNALAKFIELNVEEVAQTAFKKINFASQSFEDIQLQINTLWSDLRSNLTTIISEAQSSFDALRNEVLTYAKQIKINAADISHLGANPRKPGDFTLSLFLATLTFVELCLYIFIFILLRKKTKNFTKVD